MQIRQQSEFFLTPSNEAILREFRLVVPTQPRCAYSTAEARVSPTKIIFSGVTAAELGYPAYVCMLISNDGTRLVLQASEESNFTVPFYRPPENGKGGSNKAIMIGNTPLVKVIRQKLEWDEKGTYTTPGIRSTEGGILLFDFSIAEKRGKQPRRISPQEIFDSYPSMAEIKMNYQRLLPSAVGESNTFPTVQENRQVVSVTGTVLQ